MLETIFKFGFGGRGELVVEISGKSRLLDRNLQNSSYSVKGIRVILRQVSFIT